MPPLNATTPEEKKQQVFRTLHDLAASPEEAEKQLARFMPEDADPEEVAGELALLAGQNGAAAEGEDAHDPARASRRRFLKLMGASMAMAGLAACRWPQQPIMPYHERPEGRIPGKPTQYASAYEVDGYAHGLLVTSFDGRPIKVEGNPSHPINGKTYTVNGKPRPVGAASAQDQGSILDLYDPDRSKGTRHRGESVTRLAFLHDWTERRAPALREKEGEGLVVFAEPGSSPSLRAQREKLQAAFPRMRWLEYAAITRDNVRRGTELAYDRALRPQLKLDEAAVVVVFDEDLFNEHPAGIRYARDFAEGRRVHVDDSKRETSYDPFGQQVERPFVRNRLYVVEANFSATGAAADHRMPVAASHIGAALAQVARFVIDELGEVPPAFLPLVRHLGDERSRPLAAEKARAIARDLVRQRDSGRGLITVGPRQAPEVHALAFALNELLGFTGTTITFTEEAEGARPHHHEALAQLAGLLEAGEVSDLVILGTNPAYTAPPELGLAEKIEAVENSVHLATHLDETSKRCRWHLAKAHWLEAWGDALGYDGTVAMQQPLIDPMYESGSSIELVHFLAEGRWRQGHELVRRAWSERWGIGGPRSASFQQRFRRALHDGVVRLDGNEQPQSLLEPVEPRFHLVEPAAIAQRASEIPELGPEAMEVVLVPDVRLYDGRYANNGWLQETPEFLSTMMWDNALIVGLRTADALGVGMTVDDYADIVDVRVGHREDELITVPVYVMPGLPEYSSVLWLGFGRTDAGTIAGDQTDRHDVIGVNGYRLASAEQPSIVRNVRVAKRRGRYPLALLANHWRIDQVGASGRQGRIDHLVRNNSLEEYRKQPGWATHKIYDHFPADRTENLWEYPVDWDSPASPEGDDPQWAEQAHYKWGMAIDLSACIGCNACIVACTAENNVPVVGKDEIRMNRDMHWIRNDRYFAGPQLSDDPRDIDEDEVHVLGQVLMCVQCDMAPCEQVCPVAATVHDHHGLNVMVYNRCIGTRYCSNNCPYKVRRFNYFYNHRNLTEVEKMRFNPQVTVRSRGVMEKCTYCVQRIETTKQFAKADGNRRVEDGEIVPACAQTCPTQAIVFGDYNDENSALNKLVAQNKTYNLLNDMNTRPRTKYLGMIRNPNPELES